MNAIDFAPPRSVIGQASFEAIDHNRIAYEAKVRAFQMPYGTMVQDDMLVCANTADSRLVGFPLPELDMDVRAKALAGQHGLSDKCDNRWRFAARNGLRWPFAAAACDGGLIAVRDIGNNRVLLWEPEG